MDLPSDHSLIQISVFYSMTIGIVAYFLGAELTRRFSVLRTYSIPEPVSGGLVAALLALAVFLLTGRQAAFDLAARDVLLVYFFTTIGLNARFQDLLRGGPILGIMLVLTVGYMFVQNAIGMLGSAIFGMPSQAAVMLGTAALIGGHGTAIAWGPVIQQDYGVAGAAELGIASATLGLIMASLLGGPIAKYLIESRQLTPGGAGDEPGDVPKAQEVVQPITNTGLLRSVLWIHVSIAIGLSAFEALEEIGIRLPLFVPCLLAGILLSNVIPLVLPRLAVPTGTPSLALVSEFSLSVFLSMSLMSMQLWTLASNAGVLVTTMALQAIAATLFILFVIFPAMGRNYFAAVLSAGFTGVTLGATPTAIANMTAVTQRYGSAPLAFIVLPLVSAFFVDIANAFVIKLFLLL